MKHWRPEQLKLHAPIASYDTRPEKVMGLFFYYGSSESDIATYFVHGSPSWCRWKAFAAPKHHSTSS